MARRRSNKIRRKKSNKSRKKGKPNKWIEFAYGYTQDGKDKRDEIEEEYINKYGEPTGKDKFKMNTFVLKKMGEAYRQMAK